MLLLLSILAGSVGGLVLALGSPLFPPVLGLFGLGVPGLLRVPAKLVLGVTLVWTAWRGLRWLSARFLWRIRTKLILSYLFVALVPVVLLSLFLALAAGLAAQGWEVYPTQTNFVFGKAPVPGEPLAEAVSQTLTCCTRGGCRFRDDWQSLGSGRGTTILRPCSRSLDRSVDRRRSLQCRWGGRSLPASPVTSA